MSAIHVTNLKKNFGALCAVNDLSFSVFEGEVFGFLGPNGAGKTTTIRCMMDFLRPTSGEILIFGQSAKKDSAKIKENVGFLPADVRLYGSWTGKEHILFLEELRKRKSIARDLVERLDFNPNQRFQALSSGNRQKLGLILALMFEPKLLILDEPTMGLDPLLQNSIYEILSELQKKGTTIFMSSHNLAEVEKICARVGIIKDGKLVAVESIQSLKEKRKHIVRIAIDGSYQISDFENENIAVRSQIGERLELSVKGDVNDLIRKLASYNLKEVEISYASLEDIFLEFYEKEDRKKEMLSEIPKL